MATFFSNQTVWYWGTTAYLVQGTLTGDVTRSGNTVTLSNMSMALSWPALASGAWDVSFFLNGTQVYSARLSAGTSSIGLSNISFTVGTSDTSRSVSWSSSDSYSGSFTVTFPSGSTAPSGGSVTYNSCTWNSVNITSSLSSWGTGYSGTPNLEQIVVNSSATASDWTTKGRIVLAHATSSTSNTASVSNANQTASYDGGITIKGCTAFKVAMWGSTNVGSTNAFSNTTHYTPPAPPSATITNDGYTLTKNKVLLTLNGNQSNNNAATVTFCYRYKKSSDSSYSNWVNMGTGSVRGSKTASLELDGSTIYNFQFLQQYQGQNSEIKTVNYTAPAVPDQGILYAPVNGVAKKIIKLYGSVNGQTKEIKKLYGSVNGQSKRIF